MKQTWFPEISQPFVVVLVVDVEENSCVVYLFIDDPVQVIPKDRSAADISPKRHDLKEDRTIQKNRIAAKALKYRYHSLRIGTPILISYSIERLRQNEWLISQDDQRGVYVLIQGSQSSP